jgi:hypothetical protein
LTWLRCRSRRHLQEPSRAPTLAFDNKNRRGREDPRRYAALKVLRVSPTGKPAGCSKTKPPDTYLVFTPRCRGVALSMVTSLTDMLKVHRRYTARRQCRLDSPLNCRHPKDLSLPIAPRTMAKPENENRRVLSVCPSQQRFVPPAAQYLGIGRPVR